MMAAIPSAPSPKGATRLTTVLNFTAESENEIDTLYMKRRTTRDPDIELTAYHEAALAIIALHYGWVV